jgi:hypothetical protein
MGPYRIYQGKTTMKVISRAIIDYDLILDNKQQVFYADVMCFEHWQFLLFASDPTALQYHLAYCSVKVLYPL